MAGHFDEPDDKTSEQVAAIVAAYLEKNVIAPDEVPGLIRKVRAALMEGTAPPQTPAVPINKSVTPHELICLECGAKLKSLKRHLKVSHELSPREYCNKWGLPAEYPMVAPEYAKTRQRIAKGMGLGKTTHGRRK